MTDDKTSLTFLFTDVEGSSQLWEEQPAAMRAVLAWHDRELRRIVESHRGEVVKRTGDGIHAAFAQALDGLAAALAIQQLMQCGAQPQATADGAQDLVLKLRCGLHCGFDEQRDGDYFGTDVNRAARIMSVAHGEQILLSDAVVQAVAGALPGAWQLKDMGRVRLRSFAHAQALWQISCAGLRADFPALREQTESPHNLQASATRFFGRAQELRQLAELLPQQRLVTLHGLGGMGKTRLAMEAARAALPTFEDGVWFVELAQTTDAALVPLAVAGVLGVKEEAGKPLTDTLVQTLAPRHALIVLDNCEQVVDACAALAHELLARTPNIHVLVTSREHLKLTAEQVVEIAGLEVPSPESAPSPQSLAELDVVSLFVDRVRAVQASFELNAETAAPVALICCRLDGIPLALELAAAATRRMPVPRLAERLEDRLGTLVHGQRGAPARQKTLRALIDWSHDMLPPAERRSFQRLAVFSGGWTLEAAEAVCADEDTPAQAVIERLGELVEKSLVRMDPRSGRYSLLDTVRQYAREHLDAGPDKLATETSHLRFYLSLAESARPHLGGPDQQRWLKELDTERDNLLGAHQACGVVEGGAELGVKLSWALKPYWVNRGLMGVLVRMTSEAVKRLPNNSATRIRCSALADMGQAFALVGQYAQSKRCLDECIGLARELGDTRLEAAALNPLSLACLGLGRIDDALEHLSSVTKLAEVERNRSFLAYAESARGQVLRVAGRFDEALRATLSARSKAESLADEELIAITWLNESMVLLDRSEKSDLGRPVDLLRLASDYAHRSKSHTIIQSALEVSAAIACNAGQWLEAEEFVTWAQHMARKSGMARDPADERFLRPRLQRLAALRGPLKTHPVLAHLDDIGTQVAVGRLQNWLANRPSTQSAVAGPIN